MSERDDAITLANRILERPHADPDDDLAVLSRQFLREVQRRGEDRKAIQRLGLLNDALNENVCTAVGAQVFWNQEADNLRAKLEALQKLVAAADLPGLERDHNADLHEMVRLREQLAKAEAVCEAACEFNGSFRTWAALDEALATWRKAKGEP